MKKEQIGFTLVEIAIVLVIVGLLLGGVLKGQELINSAKARAVVNEFRNTATMMAAYQDRFRALPGDDAIAGAHLGSTSAKSGDGNGKIGSSWDATAATDESVLFWQHLRLANLATGDTAPPPSESGAFNAWIAKNAEGGRIGVTTTRPQGLDSIRGRYFICQGNLDGRIAQQVDAIMDDGNGTTGSVGILLQTAVTPEGKTTTTPLTTGMAKEGETYVVCYGV